MTAIAQKPDRNGCHIGQKVDVWVMDDYYPATISEYHEVWYASIGWSTWYWVTLENGTRMPCGKNSFMHRVEPNWRSA